MLLAPYCDGKKRGTSFSLLLEIARDHLQRLGYHNVIGGIVSPVHDSYGKKELVSATHRCEMLRLALQDSSWLRLSDWECHQEGWTRTRLVLQYHQVNTMWIFGGCAVAWPFHCSL